ncbi:hypothetical protein C0992_001315 [Termitomyces sp. T32_za158]|nr:hypothetical protein C0992_001315 [Termitomyces sp. T32_za158]
MFHKLSLVALVAPLAHALTLNIPQNPVSDGTVTISWTTQAGDPDFFTIELINQQFNNAFAIANNVNTGSLSTTLVLPVVPVGGGYTLNAVDVGNINNVFSSTGSFSIGQNPDSNVPTVAASTTVPSASATKPPSAGVTASNSAATGTASHASGSNSAFGSTVTSPSAGASNAASAASAGASNSASATPLNDNGALAFGANKAALAGVLLSALAGAVVVGL